MRASKALAIAAVAMGLAAGTMAQRTDRDRDWMVDSRIGTENDSNPQTEMAGSEEWEIRTSTGTAYEEEYRENERHERRIEPLYR